MAARTVYIDNRSGDAAIGDRAYQALKGWGRFEVVQDRKQADLVFLFTSNLRDGGFVTSGGQQTGTVDDEGNVRTTTSPTYTTRDVYRYAVLSVIDPKTGDPLWTESKVVALLRTSATKRAIDELKKRIEEQAAHSKKP
jgi:hypothetical protein